MAIRQLIKGCQLAMHNAVILADENKKLWAENNRQKRKKAVKRSFIAIGRVLTVAKGLANINNKDIVEEEVVKHAVNIQSIRASRKCSKCRSIEHTARTCTVILA